MGVYRGSGSSGAGVTVETLADQAAASAAAAAASELAAAASETNAAASEAAAAASETAAGTSETNAAASEAAAATSESNAATSEANAATSESNAATSASNAATSATNAATSETNAAASEAAAAASYDSFDDRYLGAKASDPTLDNDGNALLTGALYWNTTSAELKIYSGSAWVSLPTTAADNTWTGNNNFQGLNTLFHRSATPITLSTGENAVAIDTDGNFFEINNSAGGYFSWLPSTFPIGTVLICQFWDPTTIRSGKASPPAGYKSIYSQSENDLTITGQYSAVYFVYVTDQFGSTYWQVNSYATHTLDSIVSLSLTKGNIVCTDGTSIAAKTVGANGLILQADSTQSTGLNWRYNGHSLSAGALAASATGFEFTSLPAGVTKIELLLYNASTDAAGSMQVQLGNSGGTYATISIGAYRVNGAATAISSGPVTVANCSAAGQAHNGRVVLEKYDGSDLWLVTSILGANTPRLTHAAAQINLGSTVTRIKLTCTSGAFNGGNYNLRAYSNYS